MAKIVFGFGSSHGPLLSTPPERWDLRAQDDRENPEHPFRGKVYSFPELVEARRGERDFIKEMSIETRAERSARNQRAMDRLGQKLVEVDPDIIVLVGDDQHEWFKDDIQPAFSVYCGEQVINTALTEEMMKGKTPGLALSMKANHPPDDHVYPVPDLAREIVAQAMVDEFDVAISAEQRRNEKGLIGVGHAVGFIYRRMLKDRPVPVVPILINTYFPPNQPTAKRCYELGRSVGRAIAGWNGANANKRVAICASGGISHFVVDEEFDNRILTAIKNYDMDAICAEPENMYQSGTSETKNWITVAGILAQTGLAMNMVDYVPSYRSEGGTGCGMAFATWE